jgi:hypothetical protein
VEGVEASQLKEEVVAAAGFVAHGMAVLAVEADFDENICTSFGREGLEVAGAGHLLGLSARSLWRLGSLHLDLCRRFV